PALRPLDQSLEAPVSSLVPLGAHHPVSRVTPVPRRLRLEELPGRPVPAKLSLPSVIEPGRGILVRVDPGSRLVSRIERSAAAGVDETQPLQLREATDVDGAPHTAFATGRDSLSRLVVAQGIPHAVDPAEAQPLVDDLGPSDRRPA